ncbi:MAG: mobile mystery protein A [Pseudomonadota bacterium]
MSPKLNRLRLEQTSKALQVFEPLTASRTPSGGWLRVIREALGRTQRQQAGRLGIAAPTLHKSEKAEAEGRITLAQLRKLAAGLDCELVYALVPRRPLAEQVEAQADRVARLEVQGVTHSMKLEDQGPSNEFVQRQMQERRHELLTGKWSNLWR